MITPHGKNYTILKAIPNAFRHRIGSYSYLFLMDLLRIQYLNSRRSLDDLPIRFLTIVQSFNQLIN